MKWENITNKKGDDGKSDFQGRRKGKSSLIFEVLGEVDMLNAQLGSIAVPFNEMAIMFQAMNREIMGYIHTKGASKLNDWETIVDQILANITRSMDEDEIPCEGWVSYDNQMFVVCCQIRRVERLLCKLKKSSPPMPEYEIERFIRIFNRLSKVYFCLGTKISYTMNNISLDNEEEVCEDSADEKED
jgi:cob(I)alamin adenosyltransferase